MDENNCENMELNAKTKIGLSFKEVAWAISFIFALGWAYNDIKKDMEIWEQKTMQLEVQLNKTESKYEALYELMKGVDVKLAEIGVELKHKSDKQ